MTGYTRKDTSNNIADGNIINADDLDNEFDGVQSAFNATTGHTHDGTAAEGAPITKIGPVQDVIASASAIYPKTTNTVDLGTSSLKYKDAFLAGSASVGGALAVAGIATLTSQPILSSLTASSAVATDASKGLVSVTNTGTGNNVLATSPTLVTPLLGTPTSVTLTNATGLPISTGVSGLGTGVATALAVNVGTAGAPVVNGGVLGTPSSGTVTNLTGTASININGTVGATTPTTGAFTTLTTSSTVTLSGGTANGVAYLNGSKVLTTGAALTFDGTTLLSSAGFSTGIAGGGSYKLNYASNVDSRTWRLINDQNVFGDFAIQQSTTQTGTTYRAVYSALNDGTQFWSVAGTEQMRLTSTGLGIGTSSPARKLDVNGAIRVGSASPIEWGGTTAYITGESSTNTLFFATSSAERMRLDASGNLGIGTSSPTQKLEVASTSGAAGSALLRLTSNGSVGMEAGLEFFTTPTDTTGAARAGRIYAQFDGANFATARLSFQSMTTGNVLVDTMHLKAGNVGIGTTSPTSITNYRGITVNGTDGSLVDSFLNGTLTGRIQAYATGYALLAQGAATPLIFGTNNTERMRLDTSGNLGIGTSSPAATKRLHVADVAAGSGMRVSGPVSDNAWAGGIEFYSNNATTVTSSIIVSSGGMIHSYGGSERMRLDASGNLGLGVTPSSSSGAAKVFEVGSAGNTIRAAANDVWLTGNAYFNTGWKYGSTTFASAYNQTSGAHVWFTAPSGTAGNAITFTQAMTLDANNILSLGATASAWNPGNVAAELPQYGVLAFQNAGGTIAANAYFSTTGWKYIATNFAAKYDISQSTGGHYWRLAASGTAGNAITFIDAMTLTGGGNLLVGTTSANASLATGIQIASANWGSAVSVTAVASAGTCAAWGRSTDGNIGQFYRDTSFTTIVGSISVTASATAYNTSSDYRLKDITGPITTSGAYIDSLKPVEGTWKADGSTFVGLIAHEVQEASRTTVATGIKDGTDMQGMDYSSAEIIANLIAELQSLRARVAALESKPA